jgi:hypothetical protein
MIEIDQGCHLQVGGILPHGGHEITVIGDVHCKIDLYAKAIAGVEQSVQLGDFGFAHAYHWHHRNVASENHRILLGNHDWYPKREMPAVLSDAGFDPERSLFWVRGAQSQSRHWRTPGLDWFPHEEIGVLEWPNITSLYGLVRPGIVLTHDAPDDALNEFGFEAYSATQHALSKLLAIHRPALWIFGHHHTPLDTVVKGTRFICLPELASVTVDTQTFTAGTPDNYRFREEARRIA